MITPQRPDLERKPHQFNPTILVRSVIALPLLEQIEQELTVSTSIEKEHPRIRDAHSYRACPCAPPRPTCRQESPSQEDYL